MQLQVKGRNVEVSAPLRRHVEQKLRKLDKQLHELTAVELELWVERNPSIHDCYVAEGTIRGKRTTLRARAASVDMRTAVDALTEKLCRQVKEHREKRRPRASRGRAEARVEPSA